MRANIFVLALSPAMVKYIITYTTYTPIKYLSTGFPAYSYIRTPVPFQIKALKYADLPDVFLYAASNFSHLTFLRPRLHICCVLVPLSRDFRLYGPETVRICCTGILPSWVFIISMLCENPQKSQLSSIDAIFSSCTTFPLNVHADCRFSPARPH